MLSNEGTRPAAAILRILAFGAAGAMTISSALGQTEQASAPGDEALRKVEGVLIIGRRSGSDPLNAPNRIDAATVERADAGVAAELLELLPSANLQTNSRGEALLFLRNAGERQIALFFDGALLNVPWDNRLDLSLFPANLIDYVSAYSGPVSPQYGANVTGGVVEFGAHIPYAAQSTHFRAEGGEQGFRRIEGETTISSGATSIVAAGGYVAQNGAPLAEDARLPFSQPSASRRTNTDSEITTAAFRVGRAFADADIAVTAFYAAGDKGAAPESDRDPAEARVRFWRYPDTAHAMAIGKADVRLGGATQLKTAIWAQSFDQDIESYTDESFSTLEALQIDDNLTFGGRAALAREAGPFEIVGSFNALDSRHDQAELEAGAGGALEPAGPELRFRQRTLSGGADVIFRGDGGFSAIFGAGVHHFSPYDPGDKPKTGGFTEYSVNAALTKAIGGGFSLRGAAGRSARFPTLRELFGTALNQFLESPDLRAETTVLAEASLAYRGPRGAFEITPFARLTDDAIDQIRVNVDGQSLRRRVNIDGARVVGVEARGDIRLTDALAAHGQITGTSTRRRNVAPGGERHIAEKPNMIARAGLLYERPDGFSALGEIERRGRVFSPDATGDLKPLDGATLLNLRISYALDFGGERSAEFYLRADNITDAAYFPQAGLPAPGRWVKGGVRLAF